MVTVSVCRNFYFAL